MNIDVHSKVDKEDKPLTRTDVESLLQKVGSSDKLDLSGLNLSQINLTGVDLKGAHLAGANLMGAFLMGAYLEGAYLEGAYLEGAILMGAHLAGANLAGANLKGAHLEGAILWRANLEGAHFEGAFLEGAHLARANLMGANLERVRLEGAFLAGVHLERAHLKGAILMGANLEGAILMGAYLEGTILTRANLKGANLKGANLKGAIFAGANLKGANLKGTILAGANLEGANLKGAIGFSPDELKETTTESIEKLLETTTREKETVSHAIIQIRIDEEPLTAQNLISTLTNFVTLYTTYWLIQQERFDDALQYANHGGKHFEEEAHLIIGELKYNSPADIKFNVDLSPESFVNALKNLIDTIVQIKHRRKAIELENQALELKNQTLELENKAKEVEINKKVQDSAFEKAEKLIKISSKIDPAIRTALIPHLAEQLSQCSNPAVHITLLLPDTSIKQEQNSIVEPSPSLPEGSSLLAEPITTAIITAISAGAVAGLTDTAKTAVTDSYNKLKELLVKKFGAHSEVVQAIDRLEAKPKSQGHQQVLQEEIAAIKAEQDEEILAAAKQILILVKPQQTDDMSKLNIQNNGYVQGQNIGDHQHITQHFGDLSKIEK